MAAKAFNGWVESDVAIEIIGKMIAEENGKLNELLDEYEQRGIDEDDATVQQDTRYLDMIRQIDAYGNEIQAIYLGDGNEAIFDKVTTVYAPHIKHRHTSLTVGR